MRNKLGLGFWLSMLALSLVFGCIGGWVVFPYLPLRSTRTISTPSPTSLAPTVNPQESTLTPETSPEPATPGPSPTPLPPFCAARPRPMHMDSPEYGMQAFLWWRPETAWRDLDLIRGAGFRWVKQIFAWVDIEGAGNGIYDWGRTDRIVQDAVARDLDLVVAILKPPSWLGPSYPASGAANNYQDMADFLTALAARYKGCIRAYSIWNEPNLSREWGGPPDPNGYAALLRVAYQAIKAADPEAMVISAGLSPTGTYDATAMPDDIFLERMYQAGAAPYFDVLGLHAPGYKAPPEMSPDEVAANPSYGGQRFFAFRHVEDMRQVMVRHGDAGKQVAILEFGWTSDPRPDSPYHWHAVSEAEKADYLVRAYRYAREHWAPWIGLMSLIYVADADWTTTHEQYWWAITEPDGTPRLAYEALAQMGK